MADQPTLAFATAAAFRKWLHTNHSDHPGIWLRIFKKSSGHPTVSYAEAVDEALCYGWIDGQKQKGDEASWLQKFTKRGPRSVWSKVNVGHVDRLSREGRMQPAGFAAVESAKADGRWDRAYSPSSTAELPEDFLAELGKSPTAQAFFEKLNKTNRYAVFYRLHSAKRPETRARRIADFIAMFERGEKIH